MGFSSPEHRRRSPLLSTQASAAASRLSAHAERAAEAAEAAAGSLSEPAIALASQVIGALEKNHPLTLLLCAPLAGAAELEARVAAPRRWSDEFPAAYTRADDGVDSCLSCSRCRARGRKGEKLRSWARSSLVCGVCVYSAEACASVGHSLGGEVS